MGYLQIKRGLSENLPVEAKPGELLFTTDTKKFYVGNGEGNALTEFANAAQLANFLLQKAEKTHTHPSSQVTDFASAEITELHYKKSRQTELRHWTLQVEFLMLKFRMYLRKRQSLII